jgi:hypothetical protein
MQKTSNDVAPTLGFQTILERQLGLLQILPILQPTLIFLHEPMLLSLSYNF